MSGNSDELIEIETNIDSIEDVEVKPLKKCGRPSKNFDPSEWRKNNKDRMKKYGARKVPCNICNIELRYDSLSAHKKSSRHLKRVNSL